MATSAEESLVASQAPKAVKKRRHPKDYPWWLFAIILILLVAAIAITRLPGAENYRDVFAFVSAGLAITAKVTLSAYAIAVVIGLIVGLGRISRNVVLRNIATFYVEVIRGIPMLVLIFFLALVGIPMLIEAINGIGVWLTANGIGLGRVFTAITLQNVSMDGRAILALAITYGAFLAEIFRAGIQSISRGQMEAARSLGMSYTQAMWYVVLPQAIRNVLPALGNDFVAMLKDSSLVSVLAVRDITQLSRLYAGRTFQFREAYSLLAIMYLSMTVILSLLVGWLERRMRSDEH